MANYSDALTQALSGAMYGSANDPWGMAAQSFSAVTPALINPYQSTGSNIGIAVGGGLLAGLLGGLAENRTESKNLELLRAARTLNKAQGADRDAILESNPRLLQYANAMDIQQEQNRIESAQKQQDRLAEALSKRGEFFSPDGQVQQVFDPIEDEITKQSRLNDLELQQRKALVPILGEEEAHKITSANKAEADSLGYNPKQDAELTRLQKDFSSRDEVKNYSKVEIAAGIINKALEDDNAVTDLELTRYSIQVIEPGMAVREGEQAAVLSSGSVPEQWKGQMQKVLDGKSSLTPEIRQGLKSLAMRAYEGQKSQYDKALSFYQNEAKLKGIDPGRISYLGESTPSEKIFTYGSKGPDQAPPGMKIQRNRLTGETRVVPQ